MSILSDIQRILPLLLFVIFIIFSPDDTKSHCKSHIILIFYAFSCILLFYCLICYNVNEYIAILISLIILVIVIVVKNSMKT